MGGQILFVAVLGSLLCAVAHADYEAGMRAAQNGDYAAARREFEPLAEQGHARALTDLGFMYANGHGVLRDPAKAVALYRRAADLGLPLAQFNLGYMYLHGEGVPRDPEAGLAWYRRAADQGFIAAQFNLGVRYYTGEGVDRDLGEAYVWFALAERGGHDRAGRAREGIAKRLTPADRARLDQRLASWRPVAEDGSLPKVAAPAQAAPAPRRAAPPPVAAPRPAAPPAPKTAAPAPTPGAQPTLVQLGSLVSREDAEQEWQRLLHGNRDLLGSLEGSVQEAALPGRGTRYRVRAGPLSSPAAAEALCAELGVRRVPCLVVDPGRE